MQMRNKNLITSLFLLAFCVFGWFEVKDLPDISNYFPKICIVFLAFLSLTLLVQALRMPTMQVEKEKKNLRFVKILVGVTFAYILAIFIIGFNISSVMFLGILGYIFDPTKTKKSLLYSFGMGFFATILFYVAFGLIFNVPLPEGAIIKALS